MKDHHRPDIEAIKERAVHARALLEDKAFQYAILELRKRWFAELLTLGGGDMLSARMVAKINALEELARELALEIDNYRHTVRQGSGNP